MALRPVGRAGLNDVVATVTDNGQTDKITKGEVLTFFSRYPIPPTENRETVYREAVDSLVNTKLLTAILGPAKSSRDSRKESTRRSRSSKSSSRTKARTWPPPCCRTTSRWTTSARSSKNRIRWSDYSKSKATDATLRKFVADNRDLFSGTQVRASHILLKVEPDASEADKEKAKQKLLGIKNDIEQNKITFAAAANKYSEDPANEGGAGGDLDYFSLNTGLIEEFTDVAFKLKKGAISDPVETPFGFHLIQVTDRKEGKPIDFEQNKPLIVQAYRGRSSEKRRHRRAENRQDRRQADAQGPLPARNTGRCRSRSLARQRRQRLPATPAPKP